MAKILHLKITLSYSEPEIWREIQVLDSITFYQLHEVIQIVMGWEDAHLFEFEISKHRIGIPDDSFFASFNISTILNAENIVLSEYLIKARQKFIYTYDFGDSWEHIIKLKKITEVEKGEIYPKCVAGENNCPPEDCGGIYAFYDMLEVLKNKKHPEYKSMVEWLGNEYDAHYFSLQQTNNALKKYLRQK